MKTTGRMKYPACRQVLVLQATGMCEDVKFMSLHFSVSSLLSRHWLSVHKLPTVVHITLTHVTLVFFLCNQYAERKTFWGEDCVVDHVKLMKTYKPKQTPKTVILCLFAVGQFNRVFRKVVFRNAVWGAECICVLTEVEQGHYSRHGWQPQLPSRCLYIWLLHKWSICSN